MGTKSKKESQEGLLQAAAFRLNLCPKNGEHLPSHTKKSVNSVSTCLRVVDTRLNRLVKG